MTKSPGENLIEYRLPCMSKGGVAKVMAQKDVNLAGPIKVLSESLSGNETFFPSGG